MQLVLNDVNTGTAGFGVFALQKERECVSSLGALKSFRRYGPSEDCGADGKDGNLANEVYIVVTGTAP